jgi:uncharacterized integral membrane protein
MTDKHADYCEIVYNFFESYRSFTVTERKMFLLLVVAVIITIVVIFSIQNSVPVVITFFFWKFEASLAIVVFLSVVAGVLIAWIIAYLSSIRKYFRKRSLPASENSGGKDG